MADDLAREQSLMDSKDDAFLVFTTTNGGHFILCDGDEPTLRYYDNRGRCTAVLPTDRLAGLRRALINPEEAYEAVGWMTPRGGLHSTTEHHDRAHQWGTGSDCFRERCVPVYVKDQSDD